MFLHRYRMENPGFILVFQTNINGSVEQVCTLLQNLPGVRHCTVDVDDCDKVLRVVSDHACTELIHETVCKLGFFIQEMTDTI